MAQTSIQWGRISGIVAVQGSITLAWVIYALYLPDLLVQLGFAKSLAGTILIVEHILEIAIEPIFGGLSDRSFRDLGTREPLIRLGVVLASAFFLILPAIGLFVSPTSVWRWTLPVVAVLWASAMAVFRSPVISLLILATPQPKLPIATSYLTLVQQLIGAFRFTAYDLILGIGPLFTFAIGSFVLLGAAAFLRQVTPPSPPQNQVQTLPKISVGVVIIIVATAIGMGWGFRFLFAGLIQILTVRGHIVSSGMLGFNLLLAGFAVPGGWLAFYFGNGRAILFALVAAIILFQIVFSGSWFAILAIATILMAFALSTLLNGMVPFVLGLVPEKRAGLGLGIYFGSFGGAISFFDLVFTGNKLSLQASLVTISLIIVSLSLALNLRLKEGRS